MSVLRRSGSSKSETAANEMADVGCVTEKSIRFGSRDGAARVANLDGAGGGRNQSGAERGPKRRDRESEVQKPFEIVCSGVGDAPFFEPGLEVFFDALLQVETDDVSGVLLAGFTKQQSSGVVRFGFVNPLSRGRFHAERSLWW